MSVYEDERYLFAYQQALHKADEFWHNYDPYDNPDDYTGTGSSSEVGEIIQNFTDGARVSANNNFASKDDYIYNNASNVSIYGGNGDDTIRTGVGTNKINVNALIFGGAGNDVIQNYGADKSIIYGGSGDDTVDNWGKDVTINGGAGNDFLWGGAENSVIEYSSGDGNDTVAGFGATSTLKIGGGMGTYSTQQSGSDIIVTVGEGKITLGGAASLSSVNIQGSLSGGSVVSVDGEYIENSLSGMTINAGAGNDTIQNNYGGKSAKLYGGAGNDYLRNNAYFATIFGGSGNDTIWNGIYGDASWLSGGDGNDYIYNGENFAVISGGTGNDTIKLDDIKTNESWILYTAGDGNDVIEGFNENNLLLILDSSDFIDTDSSTNVNSYSTMKSGDNVLIKVGDGTITLKNARTTTNIININDETIELGYSNIIELTENDDSIDNARDDVTILSGAGNDTISNLGLKVSISSGDGDDSIYNAPYYVEDSSTTIDAGSGNDNIYIDTNSVTVDGGAGDDSIKNYGKNVSIIGGEGNDSIHNSASNVTIRGGAGNDTIASNYSQVSINGGDGDDFIEGGLQDKVTIDGGKGNDIISFWFTDKEILVKYFEGEGNDSISGFNADDTLNIAGSSYSTEKSGDDVIVTVGEGKITLAGAATLETVNINFTNMAWSLSDTTAKYGTADKTLVAIDGVKSLDGISLKNKVVTISDTSLNKKEVTISGDGYNLKIGKDVTKSVATKAWSLYKTKATYKQTTTAGYSLADNAINYSDKSVETLATVNGVKSLDGISLKKKVVTVSDASLNKSKVTISDGYTLKLGKDVTKPKTSKAWSLKKSTATYKQTTTAGYTLADNAINYSKKAVETLATVNGVKSTDGISLKKKVVTVSDASLNKSKVTISDGYTLKLGKDVAKPKTSKAWSLYKTKATYKQTTTAGYTLADNAINYSKKAVETLATVKGVKSLDGIKAGGKKITLKNSALKSKVTIGGGYEFDFAKDYKNATISGSSGNDSITARGKKISISGGDGNDSIKIFGNATVTGGKGNDSLWGSSYADEFVYSLGDGKDVIYGFDDKDTLTFDNLDFTTSYSKKNQAVTFKVDKGSITLKDFTATSFNVNGDTYKISGSKLVRK